MQVICPRVGRPDNSGTERERVSLFRRDRYGEETRAACLTDTNKHVRREYDTMRLLSLLDSGTLYKKITWAVHSAATAAAMGVSSKPTPLCNTINPRQQTSQTRRLKRYRTNKSREGRHRGVVVVGSAFLNASSARSCWNDDPIRSSCVRVE